MKLVALIALALAVPLFPLGAAGGNTTEVASSPAGESTSPGRARLGIGSLRPLVITGRGFKSLERVRISGGGTRKMVGASRAGRFSVRLPYAGTCPTLTVKAVGSKGSRASINLAHIHCVAP